MYVNHIPIPLQHPNFNSASEMVCVYVNNLHSKMSQEVVMTKRFTTDEFLPASSLSPEEEFAVSKKVQFQLANFSHKVVNIGGILNPIAGLFIVLTLLNKAKLFYLILWYAALMIVNIINVYVAHQNKKITPDQTASWRNALRSYHFLISILCFIYGCMGILYVSDEPAYQLFALTFLELLIIGFNIGTITDIVACCLSNIFLLIPYLSWSIYTTLYSASTASNVHAGLNLSYGITLVILSVFCFMATNAGHYLVKKFFRLSYEKVYLSQKLEDANKFLEERVKERTIKLEDSLKLVTYQATHDLLTNLPNQRLLFEDLHAMIDLAYQKKKVFSVICLHFNEIEKINDALGYQAGNSVIKTVAQRFQRFVENLNKNSTDLLSKMALTRKDVFVIINPVQSPEHTEKVIEDIFSVLNAPIFIDTQPLKLTASLGICFFPKDGSEAKSLLMNSDAAMSWAKKHGGNNFKFYTSEINEDVYKKLELENYLHNGLKNDEFKLKYQPVINIQTGEIFGAESLIRWHNPVIGPISPDKFIPIAEADGIIVPLGEWVFRSACAQIKAWHNSGFNSIIVSINMSAKQLSQKNIIDIVSDILNSYNINPRLVEIELTETTAYQKEFIPTIKKFKEMGLRLAIDDFGTGYSGLSNLKLFSIDKLKIDQSFIRDLATNSDSKAIVSNTIALAKKLHVTIVAEGVETEDQLKILQEYGCDLIQGYYFSPPIDAEDLTVLLKNKTKFQGIL